MSVFALLSLLSAVIIVFVGNFVYYKDPKNQLNKIFLVFYVLCAYWAFTEFAYRQAGDYDTARLWLKTGSFWPFAMAILLHFVLVFTEQWQRLRPRLAGFLLYGPALVFSLIDLTTNLISGEPMRMYWGWTYGQSNSVVRELADVWALGVSIMAVVLCWRFFWQAADPLKKQQAKYVTLGFFFSVTAGVVTEIILPRLDIRIPELTSTFALVEISFISYAIWKYKLFAMSTETAAEGIIATMSDALLLLSPEGRIQRVNQATSRLFGYHANELIDQPLATLWADQDQGHNPDFSQHWFAALRQTGLVNDFETSLKTKGDQNIPVSLSASIVKNRHGQLEGIVCVGRDLTERKRTEAALRRAYDELEFRVQERTAELARTNQSLQTEIVERKGVEDKLQRTLKRQTLLYRVLRTISGQLNLDTVARLTVETIVELTGWPHICFAVPNETGTHWVIRAAGGVLAAEVGVSCPMSQGVIGRVFRTKQTQVVQDVRTDPDYKGENPLLLSELTVPVKQGERVLAVLNLESDRPAIFGMEEVQLAESLAEAIGLVLENARLFEAVQIELTERERAEEQIRASLQEKEVLLKEIHHRVKNNLQVISSLLNLQSGCSNDPQVFEMFRDSQNRVRSMALIHEKLYRSENLAQVDFGDYIRDLTAHLFRSQNAHAGAISLNVQADNIFLDIDVAVPCGLIMNELASNSLKHAFPNGRSGQMLIAMESAPDHQVTLTVRDNGIGFPAEVNFRETESLGLQLVNILVEQLDGTIELDTEQGTQFMITFAPSTS